MNLSSKTVHFFARRAHFVDHMLPVWEALSHEMRGRFYVPECIADYARAKGIDEGLVVLKPLSSKNNLSVRPADRDVKILFVSAYGDMEIARRKLSRAHFIMMEHGVGLTFSGHSGYAGGRGLRRYVKLFLAPNEIIFNQTQRAIPNAKQVVVGTPKLDRAFSGQLLAVSGSTPPPAPPQSAGLDTREEQVRATRPSHLERGEKPTVCISFHWDGKHVAPEAGNAFLHYEKVLPELATCEDFVLIGHGHPKFQKKLRPIFEALGIEFVENFADVMERADLYVNDCSSTMYEFCSTGKPVVILNAPWFRRNVQHGIRFWDYTDIGPQVDEASELLSAISSQLSGIRSGNDAYELARAKAVQDLYPYWGCAAERAAEALSDFVEGKYA